MYRYVRAYARASNSADRWKEVPLADTFVADLFNQYREITLVLTNDLIQGELSLDLSKVATLFSGFSLTTTLSQWLVSIADDALPTTAGGATITQKTVKYKDGFKAGYKINLSFADGDPLTEVPDSIKNDLMLTKDRVVYSDFHQHCLVTVNGLVHRTDYDNRGIYVKDGGISFRTANENHVGILNFKDIGKLTFITITDEMIYTQPNGHVKDGAYLNLPVSTAGKMVMLVLGGYLHVANSNFFTTGDKTVKIQIDRLPLLKRFFESQKLISLEKMQEHHDRNDNNPTQIGFDDLMSEESIRSYLTLSQSFVVLVDTNNLYLEKHKLEYSHLPGRYFTTLEPVWPVRTELGRLPEYQPTRETHGWSVAIQDNFNSRYMFETTQIENQHSVDSARVSNFPQYYAQGHLLEIGTDSLIYA